MKLPFLAQLLTHFAAFGGEITEPGSRSDPSAFENNSEQRVQRP
jgi:hypothetical protein